MNIEDLNIGDIVELEYTDGVSPKLFYSGAQIVDISNGKIHVEDEEGNEFWVKPEEVLSAYADDDEDGEHDGFRSEVEADADALASAGFDEGENDFDERC